MELGDRRARERSQRTRALLISRLTVGLTLGLAFAHAVEFIGKRQLSAQDWLVVQQHLYVAFGVVGGPIEVLAVATTWISWVMLRRVWPASSHWMLAAAIVVSIGLIDWALVVRPMNGVLNGWTADHIPSEWRSVRNRWEIGHAIQAGLFAIGFVSLEIGADRRW